MEKATRVKLSRIVLIIIAWLAAGALLWFMTLRWCVYWNLFDWSPEWDRDALLNVSGVGTALAATWFLAGMEGGKVCRIIAALTCLTLAVFAVMYLPAEPLTTGMLGRSRQSPWWFRGGIALVQCMPATFLIWNAIQRRMTPVPEVDE